ATRWHCSTSSPTPRPIRRSLFTTRSNRRPPKKEALMAIVAESITKSYSGLRVLDEVGIAVADGEVHALLGANGSGKSTLAKILTGVVQPDGASITIRDRTLPAIASPQQARELGIAVVHQEAPLIDTATVAECIALFRGYPTQVGRI